MNKVDSKGVIWLSQADKLVDKDTKFYKEYDFIIAILRG
tara:strand:+ start:6005 stop:6121 length:117 start_codon:yes stop_codon:yes gene_type:complete